MRITINGEVYEFSCYAGFEERINQLGMGLLGHHGFFSLCESVTLDSKRKMVELKINEP